MLSLFRSRGSKPNPSSLANIARVTVCHRAKEYWHPPGTIEAMTAAAEAVQYLGTEAIIDAMEQEIKRREVVRELNDPCDAWAG